MEKYLKAILACGMILLYAKANAQQDPLYSQYFNSPMLINPAFAGSLERLYAGVAYRSQWSGMEGAPATLNLNGHMSLLENKIGVGVLVVQDKLGDVRNTQYGALAAYRIKLKNSTFSFGMQTGFTRYSTDPNAVLLMNPDKAFAPFSVTSFNVGAGVLLQSERYVLSISVPKLMTNSTTQDGVNLQLYSQNFYLYGSYSFYLNERIQFKPSMLLRATGGTPASLDVNANLVLGQRYTAGVFTRSANTYGVLLQAVLDNYRFGYIFEIPGKSSSLAYNTHEISLAISLDVLSSHNHATAGF
jgi:type IX secretion system PorP/SprF family membrane protein